MTASIGDQLAEARRRQGLSLKEAEKAIKIRARYLAALEEDRFDAIHGDAYAIGFIKTYAAFLGLDSEPLIDKFRQTFNYPPTGSLGLKGALHPSPPSSPLPPEPPRRLVVFGVALAAIVLVIALAAGALWRAAPRSQPKPAKHAATKSATPVTKPRDEAPPPVPKLTIKVQVHSLKGAWLRVAVDGRPVYERTLPNGETMEWQGEQSVTVRSGNATAIEVFRNGQSIGPLSQRDSLFERTFVLGEQ